MAETKAGEAAIIRSKQAKVIEEYERQLAGLRKAVTEEMAKYKEEAEAARAEGRMLATENGSGRGSLTDEPIESKSAYRGEGATVNTQEDQSFTFQGWIQRRRDFGSIS
jgi:hypothetical protein